MKWSMLLCAVALVVCEERSVRPLRQLETPPATSAEPAALFVGVREFTDVPAVPYSVDDAVDLAYAFSLEPRSRLVQPSRVVLAISGYPVKEESRTRLAQLLEADAQRIAPSRANIVDTLQQQATAAGTGLLLVSFATHGFSRDGMQYVLASDSRYEDPLSSLSVPRMLDVAAGAGRSLVIVDACRERVRVDSRSSGAVPSPAAILRAMRSVHGQAVLAPAPGEVVYDNQSRRNGVLTSAILDATLKCKARTDGKGVVTVETLAAYVEKYVREWIKRNRRRTVNSAIQLSVDGSAGSMPLSRCGDCAVTGVAFEGRTLRTASWSRTLDGPIIQVEQADLDDDGCQEVIAAVGDAIRVFSGDGQDRWVRRTKAPIRKFVIGGEQIAALSRTHLTILDATGERRDCAPAGMLHEVVFDRPTARHARRVIVAGTHDYKVLLARVEPKTCATAWLREVVPSHQFVEKLEAGDADNDARRDVTLTTTRGSVTVNFDGEVVTSKDILLVPIHKNAFSVSSN